MSDKGLDMLVGDADDAAPEKGQVVTAAAEPVGDAMSNALSVFLPDAVQLRVATIAARYGIDPRADPTWALVESVKLGADCAQASAAGALAAGNAARAVQAGVAGITDLVFAGAVQAGDEVKGALRVEIRDRAVEAGQALKMLIDSAASTGATSLKTAASELDVKLGKIPADVQKSLDAYKEKGVVEFATAAKEAGKAAAKSASYASFRLSAIILVLVMALGGIGGAGGEYAYLQLTHQAPISDVTDFPMPGGTLLVLPDNVTAPSPGECPTGGKCVTIPTPAS
ncbi:protein of unknown function [Acidithiobacillus ferrivorans]|uniref:Uncharacterized protein n=1 Tax=Acidithiobacillus ferrivorans TaxID=160808 RepID=A0A060UUF2_9PROT|nr:hypothetical protein [Acidithiobacillus ferrivorans]CDQ10204.1 hypothetical protein AFERRI_40156 [Acidithiobacillus ferrivorans]SMH64165.1 protein of unknown function [Acidithiobacillus ferrivorans]